MSDALHLCNKFLEATTSHNCSNSNQRKLTSYDNNDDNDDVSLRHIRNEAKRKRGRPSVGTEAERRPKKSSRRGTLLTQGLIQAYKYKYNIVQLYNVTVVTSRYNWLKQRKITFKLFLHGLKRTACSYRLLIVAERFR